MNQTDNTNDNPVSPSAFKKADVSFKLAYLSLKKQYILQFALQLAETLLLAIFLATDIILLKGNPPVFLFFGCAVAVSGFSLLMRGLKIYLIFRKNYLIKYLTLAYVTGHSTVETVIAAKSIEEATSSSVLRSKPRVLLFQRSPKARTQDQIIKATYSIKNGLWYSSRWMHYWWTLMTVLTVSSIIAAAVTLVLAPRVNVGEALMLDFFILAQWVLEIMGLNAIGRVALMAGTCGGSLFRNAFTKVKSCFRNKKQLQEQHSTTQDSSMRKVSMDTADSLSFESADCSICLGAISQGHMIYHLQCSSSHRFHSECLEDWMVDHTTCPYCRAQFEPKGLSPVIHKEIQ